MNYIKQINAFASYAECENVPAMAQLLYFRLLIANNRVGWKEWFGETNQHLMIESGITAKSTFLSARAWLTEHGLIEVKPGRKNKATEYRVKKLYAYTVQHADAAHADVPNADSGCGSEKGLTPTLNGTISLSLNGTNNPLPDKASQGLSDDLNHINSLSLKTTNDVPINKDKYKNIYNKQPPARVREDEVIRVFSKNIHPVTGQIEIEKLNDLVERYTADRVILAIHEAVECNGRTLRYIESILASWARRGGKEVRGGKSKTERVPARVGRAVQKGWEDEPDEL